MLDIQLTHEEQQKAVEKIQALMAQELRELHEKTTEINKK